MRLTPYFIVSLAAHGMILTFPLSSFEEARERIVPVTLRLEHVKEIRPERVRPAAVSRPATIVADNKPDDKKGIVKSQIWSVRELSTVDEVAEIKASKPRPIERPARQTVSSVAAARSEAPPAATKKPAPPREDFGLTIGEDNDQLADMTFSSARYAYNPKPDYPAKAKREGWEGTVLLQVLVNPQGAPESIEVNRSSGFEILDRAARDTVLSWRFHPAYYGDRQVSSWVRIPIVFRLKDTKT